MRDYGQPKPRDFQRTVLMGDPAHFSVQGGANPHTRTRWGTRRKVDRELAIVSTANIDRRSFELNFEVSLVVYDTDFASRLRLLQKNYIDDSIPVEPGRWARRGWPTKLGQNTAGMLAPLL